MAPIPEYWLKLATAYVLLGMLGCDGLQDFATGPDEVYRGRALGTSEPLCPAEPCSFIRRGFPEGLEFEMTFDPIEAASAPGRISSGEGACGRFFDDDPLLPIAPLSHDDLSLYVFPGARLNNYIFAVAPRAGPLQGRDVMAFVSLHEDGVEVRIIAGSGARACDPSDCDAFARGECDFFGVFKVQKESL